MSRNRETRVNSDLYAKIKALPLTAAEREVAIVGLRDGELVADAIVWLVNGFKRLTAGPALKPSLKH